MENYSFEKWMLGASTVLLGLMILPTDAQASIPDSVASAVQNPMIWLGAMTVNYVLIKLIASPNSEI